MEKYDEALDGLKEAVQFLSKSEAESLEADALRFAQMDAFWELIGWGNSEFGVQHYLRCAKCFKFPSGSLQFVCAEGHLTCTNCGCEKIACSYIHIRNQQVCRRQVFQNTVTLAQKTISGYFLKKGEQENSPLAVATIPGGLPVPAEATPADAPEPEITTPFHLQAEPQAEIASVSEPKSEITTEESRSHGEIVTETVPVVEVDSQPEISTTEAIGEIATTEAIGEIAPVEVEIASAPAEDPQPEIATTEASGETAPVEDEIASAPAKDPQPEIATTEASGEIAPVEVEIASAPAKDPQPEIATTEASGEIAPVEVEIASAPAEDPQPKIATVEINGGIEIEPQAKTAPGDTHAQPSTSNGTAEVLEMGPSQKEPQLDETEMALKRANEKLKVFQERFGLTLDEIVQCKKLAVELYSTQGPAKLKQGFLEILTDLSNVQNIGIPLSDLKGPAETPQ